MCVCVSLSNFFSRTSSSFCPFHAVAHPFVLSSSCQLILYFLVPIVDFSTSDCNSMSILSQTIPCLFIIEHMYLNLGISFSRHSISMWISFSGSGLTLHLAFIWTTFLCSSTPVCTKLLFLEQHPLILDIFIGNIGHWSQGPPRGADQYDVFPTSTLSCYPMTILLQKILKKKVPFQ